MLRGGDMRGCLESLRFPVVRAKALRSTLTSPVHGGMMLDTLLLRVTKP